MLSAGIIRETEIATKLSGQFRLHIRSVLLDSILGLLHPHTRHVPSNGKQTQLYLAYDGRGLPQTSSFVNRENVKVKCTVVQALRLCTSRMAHRGSRGIALLFLDQGTRRGEGSALRPGRSVPPGKTRYPLYRRLGDPQGRSGQVRKISPPPGFDPRTDPLVASRYTDYTTRPTSAETRKVKSILTELRRGLEVRPGPGDCLS